MASEKSRQFLKESENVAFDYKHRATIRFNISKYDAAVEKGKSRYKNLELAKEKAAILKRKVLKNLPFYLEKFEKNAVANGCEVKWAVDANEAIDIISKIVKESNAQFIVKSKSMTSEEVELNSHLQKIGVQSIETDLG